jgi:hypothetical protein
LAVILLTLYALSLFDEFPPSFISSPVVEGIAIAGTNGVSPIVPQELLDHGIYNASSDFENSIGIRPPFWDAPSNASSSSLETWGPCYPPHRKVDWNYNDNAGGGDDDLEYMRNKVSLFKSVEGGCRPGFLIIGAGKCGTSSLYHYLVGHPRVVPAYEKQIHYFKVSTTRSVQ